MTCAGDIFQAAMALMDEISQSGEAMTDATADYELRAPGILNALISEKRLLSGERGGFMTVETLEDPMIGIEDNYALGVMQYGLAANLLVDENPAAASFYEQRYEELRDRFMLRQDAGTGDIEDMYGGIEFGRFSRW